MIGKRIFLLWISLAGLPAAATPPPPQAIAAEPVELIVLLAGAPEAPTPEALVADIGRGRSPFRLPVQPFKARTLLPFRASGARQERLRANPDTPRARLERYVVLSFPPNVNLEAIKTALAAQPHVLHVEENRIFQASAVPTDPLIQITASPLTHQWGSHLLKLPAAWDRIRGHAYVGLTDHGLYVDHPDLRAFHQSGSENCSISNFSQYGIEFAPTSGNGKLFVEATRLRNNGAAASGGGLHLVATAGPGFTAVVNNLWSEGNVFGLKAETIGVVTVRNSIAAGNGYSGFSAVTPPGSGQVRMTLENSLSAHNGTIGVLASGNATVTLSDVVATGNHTGLNASSGGTILSLGNNKVQGNIVDGTPAILTSGN